MNQQPTAWLEVDTGVIADNVKAIQKRIGPAKKIMAVIKSDAYGMGRWEVARAVKQAGAHWIGVGYADEAYALEQAGITGPYFLLYACRRSDVPLIVERGYVQAITHPKIAEWLSVEALHQDKIVEAHLDINTGMNRLGLTPNEAYEKIDSLLSFPNLKITGIFTHLSSASQSDKTPTNRQIQDFNKIIDALKKRKIFFSIQHLGNSATILDMPEIETDMVRVGILLYGIPPSLEVNLDANVFRPAISLKSRVEHLARIEKGDKVSYGETWTAPESGTIATLSIGTADGFPGQLSNLAEVLIRGKRFPIAGRICMDVAVAFLGKETGIEFDDEAVLLGQQGNESIAVQDWMRLADLDAHEILTGLGRSLPKFVAVHRLKNDAMDFFSKLQELLRRSG